MPVDIADFTTDGDAQAVCQRCKLSFPPGTQLHYMHDHNPGRAGKYLCEGCRQYHMQKTQSRQHTQGKNHPQKLWAANHYAVRRCK